MKVFLIAILFNYSRIEALFDVVVVSARRNYKQIVSMRSKSEVLRANRKHRENLGHTQPSRRNITSNWP